MLARAVRGAAPIEQVVDVDGERCATVSVDGYDDVKRLPKVLQIDGEPRLFAFTGWDSDRHRAYFQTGRVIGRAA